MLPPETKITWRGVIPAITTPFDAELKIDHAAVQEHVRWLIGRFFILLGKSFADTMLEPMNSK